MASGKVRIYDLARELNIPNKKLIDLLKSNFNINVKSHSSTISRDDAQKLKKVLAESESAEKQPSKDIQGNASPKEQQAEPQEEHTHSTAVGIKVKPDPPQKPVLRELADQNRPVEKNQEFNKQEKISKYAQAKMREIQKTSKPVKKQEKPTTQKQQQPQQQQEPHKPTPASPYPVSRNKYKQKPEGERPQRRVKPGQKPQYRDRFGTQQQENQTDSRPQRTEKKPGTQFEQRQETKPQKPFHQRDKTERQEGQQQRQEGQQQRQEGQQQRQEGQQQRQERPKTFNKPGDRDRQQPQRERPRDPRQREARPESTETRRPEKDRHHKPNQRTGTAAQAQPQTQQTLRQQPGKAPFKKDSGKKKDFKDKERYEDAKPITEVFKKKKTQKKADEEAERPTIVAIESDLTIADLSHKLHISSAEIIKELMKQGVFATINETISKELAKDVTQKLDFEVKTEEALKEEKLEKALEEEEKESQKVINSENMEGRAPIVTILGHVDHGKTTLLDAIRHTNQKLVDAEVGGITQSIGAYTVDINNKKIVFIDTPGHEAFTAMRARGAQATDIAILIVAADDGIMPQTVEAINHAKAAEVPIIVAVNKVDKAGSDPDRVLQQLTEHNLIPEAWGGDTVTVKVSALKGDNIEELLEMITIIAEIQELKADPTIPGTGVVIESELDKGKGAIASVLVQNGSLAVGDFIAVGTTSGKIRALINDVGERINKAGPSTPVEILGLSDVPNAGDKFEVVKDDKTLKQIINKRKEEEREKRLNAQTTISLQKDSIFKAKKQKMANEIKELNMIIKADTDGSAKAVESALQEFKTKEIVVKIIHTGVGDVSEADVMLAQTSEAIVIGFGVKVDNNAAKTAQETGVSIRNYDIIYQISEDIEKTMLGLLEPEFKEVELGKAEVRNIFTFGKNIVIAGCYVLEGKIVRNKTAVVERKGKEVFKGNLDNLKRFKDDAKEVAAGYECGISFNKFNNLEEGDIIKVSGQVEVEREHL